MYEEATGAPAVPLGQDTAIVTEYETESKTTRAVAAGPRVTSSAS